MVNGYKCFNKGLISRYGDVFEEGKIYHVTGDIKYQKNGFHMCQNLEDTLRYFDAFNDEVDIANVTGFGEIHEYEDNYNGFYELYAVEYLMINHILFHDEIIRYALDLSPERVKRFISLYKLTSHEIKLFQDTFASECDVIKTIDYYQNNNKKAFVKVKK